MLYQDEAILAVEKPAGMALSVPPGKPRRPGTLTLQDQVLEYVRSEGGRKAGAWGVHDLDREASGIVVFARSPAAAESVRSAFGSKKGDAIYLAVVDGVVGAGPRVVVESGEAQRGVVDRSSDDADGDTANNAEARDDAGDGESNGDDSGRGGPATQDRPFTGTVRSFVRRVGPRVESIPPDEFTGDRSGGKRVETPRLAITHYRVVASGHGRTLMRLRLKSPRMHQARVHMQDLRHPVTGDSFYGAGERVGRTMLHLAEITFPHPTTHKAVRLSSPTPGAFWQAVGAEAPAEAGAIRAKVREAGTPGRGVDAPGEASAESATASASSELASAADAGEAGDADRGWEHVAEWYDALVAGKRNDLQDEVVTPGVLKLLEPRRGERVLDVACGPGELVLRLAAMGVESVGVDAAPRMIEIARHRSEQAQSQTVQSYEDEGGAAGAAAPVRFEVADARSLRDGLRDDAAFDAITCVMALMNIDDLGATLEGVASLLKPGGRFVAVVLHPAFRSPGITTWGWASQPVSAGGRGGMAHRQYRRVDAYLSHATSDVTMNPGAVSRGEAPVMTHTHHRPVGAYVSMLGRAGLLVDCLEEWASPRRSQAGPRAAEEDRARREIPIFMAVRAVKGGCGGSTNTGVSGSLG
ncbi:MAG: pseudouridine synthase [Phycisphaerales bacterium]